MQLAFEGKDWLYD